MTVPRAKTVSYGVLDVLSENGRIAKVRGLVEKPDPSKAPSAKAVIGRYILEPSIFDKLDMMTPGIGGELQLTDAFNADLKEAGVNGYRFCGERFDCGSIQGLIQATVAFGLDRPDLRDEFDKFVHQRFSPALHRLNPKPTRCDRTISLSLAAPAASAVVYCCILAKD